MRATLAALGIVTAVAGSLAVVSVAAPTTNGLPAYTDGYATWPRINKRPFSTPGAHNGVKNVYTSRQRGKNRLFPNGTVIVKSIAAPAQKGRPGQVAVMRKVNGRWRWVEYTLTGRRYGVLAQGALCSSCHMQVKARDWVFTRPS